MKIKSDINISLLRLRVLQKITVGIVFNISKLTIGISVCGRYEE